MKKLIICLLVLFVSLTSYVYAEDDIVETGEVIRFGNFKKREVLYRIGGLDGEYFQLWYMTDMNDEPIFCLEKGIEVDLNGEYKLTNYNKDELYKRSPRYGNNKRTFPELNELAKIIDAYKKIGDSYAAYAAVQCMIWDMQGTSTKLSNHTIIRDKIKEIKAKIKEEEISLKPSFDKVLYKPYKTNFIKDKNGVIDNRYEIIEKSEGIENIKIINNQIFFDITSTYPKEKYIKLSAKNNLNLNVDSNKAKVYLSDGNQTIFAYEGVIDRDLEDVEIKMTYDTGDFTLIKKDEFGNIAKGESSFRIYDCNNNEILNKDNTFWTTNQSQININNLLAPGIYYIEEIATNNIYNIHKGKVKFEIIPNKNTVLEFINNHKKYNLNYYKSHNNLKIDGTKFKLYDLECEGKDVYFIAKGIKINLKEVINIECDDIVNDVYEINDNNLIAHENTYINLHGKDIYVLNKEKLKNDYLKSNIKLINNIVSGEDYLKLNANTKYEIYDNGKMINKGISDEFGYVSLKNYQNKYYDFRYEDIVNKYEVSNDNGIIHLKELMSDHKYLLCEYEANPEYTMNNSDVCYLIDTSKELKDIEYKNIHNDLKQIEFKLYKTNGLGKGHLLNNAHYDVYYYLNDNKIELGEFITGALKIDKNDCDYYEIYNDDILIDHESINENELFIPNLREGEYLIKLYKDDKLYKTYKENVYNGSFVIKNLPYGASLYLVETKAPSSYKKDENPINIKLELDKYNISAKHHHLNELIIVDTHAW